MILRYNNNNKNRSMRKKEKRLKFTYIVIFIVYKTVFSNIIIIFYTFHHVENSIEMVI